MLGLLTAAAVFAELVKYAPPVAPAENSKYTFPNPAAAVLFTTAAIEAGMFVVVGVGEIKDGYLAETTLIPGREVFRQLNTKAGCLPFLACVGSQAALLQLLPPL